MPRIRNWKNIDADIINVAIEELIRHSFELPGFTSFIYAARIAKPATSISILR